MQSWLLRSNANAIFHEQPILYIGVKYNNIYDLYAFIIIHSVRWVYTLQYQIFMWLHTLIYVIIHTYIYQNIFKKNPSFCIHPDTLMCVSFGDLASEKLFIVIWVKSSLRRYIYNRYIYYDIIHAYLSGMYNIMDRW